MEHIFPSPLGLIRLCGGNTLTHIDLCAEGTVTASPCELFTEAERQILEYLDGKRQAFDLPFALLGTPFQLSIWNAARLIPYGETITYGELAQIIGKPRAARAVGNAMGANPLPLIVPCHRVLAADGIGGFSYGVDIKRTLLRLEGIIISNS